MESLQPQYMEVSYRLYDVTSDSPELMEEAPEEQPFAFLTELDMALPAFEQQVKDLVKGDSFNFTLEQENAYGPRFEERVIDLDKSIFTINGHFDHENIYEDAIVPLQNADGQQLLGRVVSISDDKVRMDMNHPLAGMRLRFEGKVVESRPASKSEIEQVMHHSCGCGCGKDHHDSCDCGHDDSEQCDHDHCGCGHCH